MTMLLINLNKEYADDILSKERHYVFAKNITGREFDHILIRVDGHIVLKADIREEQFFETYDLNSVWLNYYEEANKKKFIDFFKDVKIGYAFDVKNIYEYKKDHSLDYFRSEDKVIEMSIKNR